LQRRHLRLRELIDDVVRGISFRVEQKGLDLHVVIPDDVPDEFLGDPLRVRQVLLNLVSNAYKFTDEGHITIDVAAVDVSPGEARLKFSVIDTGIGISPVDQERIFAPFAQVDESSTRRHGGTGLGLAIASDLIRAMGGALSVESQLNAGSNFSFTLDLPRYQGKPGTAVRAPAPEADGERPLRGAAAPRENLNVLLAEDGAANQLLVVHALSKRGHKVQVARDGQEAVDWAAREEFDVILMDVQMPRVDGFQATAAIRQLPGRASVPIIALTAHAMSGDRERCLAAGMTDYLTKPLNVRELVEVVAAHASQPFASETP
jgi:CheY-like chemotaxis protein